MDSGAPSEAVREGLEKAAAQTLRSGGDHPPPARFRAEGRNRPAHREPVQAGGGSQRPGPAGRQGRRHPRRHPTRPPATTRSSPTRVQIQQVLLTLIRNGVDAMIDSSDRALIISSEPAEGDMVQINVADNRQRHGAGGDGEAVPAVRHHQGPGHGASACRSAGPSWNRTAGASGPSPTSLSGRSSTSPCRRSMPRIEMSANEHVHIVDDDEPVREIPRLPLPDRWPEGVDLRLPPRLPDAAAKLTDGCVVTDVRMPEMDGLTMLSACGRGRHPARDRHDRTGGRAHGGGRHEGRRGRFPGKAVRRRVVPGHGAGGSGAFVRAADAHPAGSSELDGKLALLSQRERQVLDRLIEGEANKVIAYNSESARAPWRSTAPRSWPRWRRRPSPT